MTYVPSIIPIEERARYLKGNMGARSGFGVGPAVLVVDMTRAFRQPREQPAGLPLSLDMPVGAADDATLGDLQKDTGTPTPAETLEHEDLTRQVARVLETLRPREAEVIRLRFGLGGGDPQTLEQVGRRFGLTRERIRQIEKKALRRLRHPRRQRLLEAFAPNPPRTP